MKKAGQKVADGVAWLVLEKLTNGVLGFVILAFLARLLTPADFGVVAAAMIFVGLPQNIAFSGIGYVVIQDRDKSIQIESTAVLLSILSGILLAGIGVFAAPEFARWLSMPEVEPAIQVLSAVFLIRGAGAVAEYVAVRSMDFNYTTRVEVTACLLGRGVVGIGLAWAGAGVWALLISGVSENLVRYGLYLVKYPWRWESSPRLVDLRTMARKAAPFTGSAIANYVTQQSDAFLLGRAFGATSLGLYSRGRLLASSLLAPFSKGYSRIGLPSFSAVQGDHDRVVRGLGKAICGVSLTTLPPAAFIALLAPEMVSIVLGAQWDGAAPVALLSAFSVYLATAMSIPNQVMLGIGRSRSVLLLSVVQAGLMVSSVGLALMMFEQIVAVAAAVLAAFGLCYLLSLVALRGAVKVRMAQLVRFHIPALWLAGLIAVVTGPAVLGFRSLHLPATLVLILAGTIAAGVLIIAVRAAPAWCVGVLEPDMRNLTRRLVQRRPGSYILPILFPASWLSPLMPNSGEMSQ